MEEVQKWHGMPSFLCERSSSCSVPNPCCVSPRSGSLRIDGVS